MSPEKGKSPRGDIVTQGTGTAPPQARRREPDCRSRCYRTSLVALSTLLVAAALLEVYTFQSLKDHVALRRQCCFYGLLECVLATLFYFQVKSLKPQNMELGEEGIRV